VGKSGIRIGRSLSIPLNDLIYFTAIRRFITTTDIDTFCNKPQKSLDLRSCLKFSFSIISKQEKYYQDEITIVNIHKRSLFDRKKAITLNIGRPLKLVKK